MKRTGQAKQTEPARVTLRLPQKLWDAVRRRALDEHSTAAALTQKAIEQFMRGGRS